MNNNDFLKKINKDEINRIYNKKNTHTFLLDDNLSDFELCSQLDKLSKCKIYIKKVRIIDKPVLSKKIIDYHPDFEKTGL